VRPAPTSKPNSIELCRSLINLGLRPEDHLTDLDDAPGWYEWLTTLFPDHFTAPFADFHEEMWEWVWSIELRTRPDPFVAIWSRGSGKSTNTEAASVALAARQVRRYVWYVCETQEQSDDHVQNIAGLLESPQIALRYPHLSDRRVGKFGNPRAWRRNRVWTRAGFIVDALGLDVASRGKKLEEHRPDFIILDDIDNESDSPFRVEKKIATVTRKVIPAGAPHVAVLAVQNLIHDNSVFSRLADGRAEFLSTRTVCGPYPAIRNLTYEVRYDEVAARHHMVITGGESTWSGLPLPRLQEIANDIGVRPFLAEYQHEKSSMHGKMYADVFHESVHILPPFPLPASWWVDRAFDWGSSSPFATLWMAESNGEEVETASGVKRYWPKGTLFVIAEDYGWNGRPNEGLRLTNAGIGQRIRAMDDKFRGIKINVHPGPADTQIFNVSNEGKTIAADMAPYGVQWLAADKRPGSRVTGWKHIYDRLVASNQTPMEAPGLFIFAVCPQLIRTLPLLNRDVRNADDIEPGAEDHLADCLRYRCLHTPSRVSTAEIRGV
jgi:hypothetical protein